jgi:hypothetical protein
MRLGAKQEMISMSDEIVKPPENSVASMHLLELVDVLDEFTKLGGRVVFWTCQNKCGDLVDWNHDGGKSVATCRKCGNSNALHQPERTE